MSADNAEQIVGFDARDYSDDFAIAWPQARQAQFLYRFDIRKVLSVDVRVWPTLLASMQVSIPYQAALQYLWADAGALRTAISSLGQSTALPAFRTIAVTLVDDGAASNHPVVDRLKGLVNPPETASTWRLLGYDVADAWLLSALSNCGFLPGIDDADSLRRSWGAYLNDFHLFADVAAASAFRRMSDIRLKDDHAPVFVYGIHLVRS